MESAIDTTATPTPKSGGDIKEGSFSLLEEQLDDLPTQSSKYNDNDNHNDNDYDDVYVDAILDSVVSVDHNTTGATTGAAQRQQQRQRSNLEQSYTFTDHDLQGLGSGDFNASWNASSSNPEFHASSNNNSNKMNTKLPRRQIFLPNNHLFFWGRDAELQTLHQAVQRISLEWMENPSEVLWISGPVGVGKTTLVKHLLEQVQQQGQNDADLLEVFVCRGSCEQYSTATQPFRALHDCLNDLCLQLLANNEQLLWKARLTEALGGEGPLLCTICPTLCRILECPPMDRRSLTTFDANTPRRLERLAFAVRDVLQAVTEYHPLIMAVDNIHWADADSIQLMQDLLTTKPLQNFLLVGLHDSNLAPDHPLLIMKQRLSDDNDNDNDDEDDTDPPAVVPRNTHVRLQVLSLNQVEEMLCRVFLEDPQDATAQRIDEIQDLAELLFALSKGNPLWMTHLLRLWNDLKLITSKDPAQFPWEWNRKKLKKEIKVSRDEGHERYKTLEGTLKARLEQLPKKILFVVLVLAKLRLTSIPLQDDQFYRVFQAAAYHKAKKTDKDPITSQEELEKMVLKACHWGILKKLQRPHSYRFSSDLLRECAASMTSPYGATSSSSSKKAAASGGAREALTMQLYMGTELSALAMGKAKPPVAGQPPPAPRPAHIVAELRERYKFLAVEQLHTCAAALDDVEKGRLAKINLEAAEIAIAKTAFQTAIVYLERSVAAVDHTLRWQQRYYDVTLRTFLFLARMRLCCGRRSAAKAACDEIMDNCTTVKDQVYANQVLMVILQQEGKYDLAQERILSVLQRLGEVFPPADQTKDIVAREVALIRKALAGRTNQQLLNPMKLTDKKFMDIMMLLANLVEISRHTAQNPFEDLATIRMMHLSLSAGFTRQYPLAFSLFAKILVERGLIKDAHRLGQIAERVARLNDFYGGEAVALFHWHVSHWRRTYKRNLETVLGIYNAQVDSGDFHHVGFSISTYIQYHLASGFDLEKLNDNLHLFQGLYQDYNLDDEWQLQIPQQAVSNLLGESATPLIFFGTTLHQQDVKLEELRKAGLNEAIQYLHFLRLFVAFFFHDLDVMEECFEMLDSPPKGVWTPWLTFFKCYLLIQQVNGSKGKKRKDLKESIEQLKGQLIDWYNEGAPNPNAMTSLLQAEYIIAKEAGKGLSAMKAQDLFNNAVEAAVKDGATHLEAFACERAGQHFGLTGVQGYCTDYLKKSYKAYEQCQYIAKVIDLETHYADKLKITKRRARPAASYINANAHAVRPSDRVIGGGQQEVKMPNVKKGFQQAAKVLRKGPGLKKTTRKVKNLFKKEKAEPAPWGWNSKNQIALDDEEDLEAGEDEHDDAGGGKASASPNGKKRQPLFGFGRKKKNKDSIGDEDEDNGRSPTATSPTTPASPSDMKSPSKSPHRPLSSRLFGKKSKPPLTEMDVEGDQGGEDINDMLESPKPKGTRTFQGDPGSAWDLPMEEDEGEDFDVYDEGVDDGADSSPKSKKDKKKKKGGKS